MTMDREEYNRIYGEKEEVDREQLDRIEDYLIELKEEVKQIQFWEKIEKPSLEEPPAGELLRHIILRDLTHTGRNVIPTAYLVDLSLRPLRVRGRILPTTIEGWSQKRRKAKSLMRGDIAERIEEFLEKIQEEETFKIKEIHKFYQDKMSVVIRRIIVVLASATILGWLLLLSLML